jgi:hypothetical protein
MSYSRNIIFSLPCIIVLFAYFLLLQPHSLTGTFAETDGTAQYTFSTSIATNSTSSNLKSWCFEENRNDCYDMSNNASTYVGIALGAASGGVISWWIYNRQNKTSRKQDDILRSIEEIEKKNTKILMHLEAYAKHHDLVLDKMILLNENVQTLNQKTQNILEEQK